MKYVASCSFGKDSLATILLAKKYGEPLDEIVYCEVMFDETTSGEIPEHIDFIKNKAIPTIESWGYKIKVLRSEKTYISSFYRVVTRGKLAGKINAFPLCGRCCIQRDCKIPPIEKYKRSLPTDTIQYIGIEHDEQERLSRLKEGLQISLLEKYKVDSRGAKDICEAAGLLSPIYEFTERGGCWFCPNAKEKELRHLYDHHKELWNKMLELQAAPNKATELFNREQRFDEIDYNFRMDDAQMTIFDFLGEENIDTN